MQVGLIYKLEYYMDNKCYTIHCKLHVIIVVEFHKTKKPGPGSLTVGPQSGFHGTRVR